MNVELCGRSTRRVSVLEGPEASSAAKIARASRKEMASTPPVLRVALINGARADTAFAQMVRSRAQRTLPVAADCGADVILPGAASVGVVTIVARRELQDDAAIAAAAKRLNILQERFEAKVGFVVLNPVDTDAQTDAVLRLQLELDPEGLILSMAHSLEQAVQQLEKLSANLADRNKRRQQSEYCASKAAKAASPGEGMRILCEFLGTAYGASAVDQDLLMVSFPTLQRLVSTNVETILQTCPIELSTVDALKELFQLK